MRQLKCGQGVGKKWARNEKKHKKLSSSLFLLLLQNKEQISNKDDQLS